MDGWSAGDVAANGIRLHYARTGGAKPPLVLAHGVTDDGSCWTPIAEALAADRDVVMVDARGHGCSDAPERGYDFAALVADLAGLIAALGPRRPAVLGHSLGAAAALALAGTVPDAPGALLLEDPPPVWMRRPETPEFAAYLERERQLIVERKCRGRDALVAERRAEAPHWAEAELVPWAEAKLRVSPHVREVFDPGAPERVDWAAALRRIACPALLIAADPERGGMVTPEATAALRGLVPQVRVAHVAGAGHNVRRDQPARYLAAVRAFLAEQPAA